MLEQVGLAANHDLQAGFLGADDTTAHWSVGHAHTALVLACVEAGLPTLCEKPVAPSGADGAELLRRLTGSDVPVQLGFQRRYDTAIAAAKAAVDSGDLGWITTVRSTTLDPEPPTPEYVAVSGGMFRDCGVHDFDIIRWVSGQ